MSKKMMLLALAVAALFALPSVASAEEIHISGVGSFTGSAGEGTLTTNSEPQIKCTKNSTTGSFDAGSTTTGKITLDFTGCTAEFLGATPSCNTKEAAAGTIASSGTFHLITIKPPVVTETTTDRYPGILVTPVATTIICSGFLNITTGGNVIGTITSPACGASSKEIKTVFTATGATQEHTSYTSKTYNLTAQTNGGAANPSGLNAGTVTLTSATTGTLECT